MNRIISLAALIALLFPAFCLVAQRPALASDDAPAKQGDTAATVAAMELARQVICGVSFQGLRYERCVRRKLGMQRALKLRVKGQAGRLPAAEELHNIVPSIVQLTWIHNPLCKCGSKDRIALTVGDMLLGPFQANPPIVLIVPDLATGWPSRCPE